MSLLHAFRHLRKYLKGMASAHFENWPGTTAMVHFGHLKTGYRFKRPTAGTGTLSNAERTPRVEEKFRSPVNPRRSPKKAGFPDRAATSWNHGTIQRSARSAERRLG
jgi:hypothetical protein